MAKLPKITSRRQMGHAPWQTASDGLHCRSCFGKWPCEVNELQAVLRKYGRHEELCHFVRTGGPCDCGWEAHEAALAGGDGVPDAKS